MRIRLTPQAVVDIELARAWYETQTPGTGVIFVARVDEAMEKIAANPEIFQKVVGDVRRARMQRFPYGIFYRVELDESVVVACLHYRRDPELVQTRAVIPTPPR